MELTRDQEELLLKLAREAIEHRLRGGKPLKIDPQGYSPPLSEPAATFVTLHVDEKLHGCIGTLEAHFPLVTDVVQNAASAAFSDPRFPPLTLPELESLKIEISILTPSEPISFVSEEELLKKIRPGVDGLILREGHFRATFLPSVWETLPDPRDFLKALKRKAGLRPDYWSSSITVSRYSAQKIS